MRAVWLGMGIIGMCVWVAPSVHAVKRWKASNYDGGAQIWFEAEDFDERDSPNIYQLRKAEAKIGVENDAFGDAMTNARGADGGWLLYRFDISKAAGKGGEWYFWGRVVNPDNQSDWLWVVGVDGKEIPKVKPKELLDAGNVAAQATNRIFEESVPPPWRWDGGTREGHRHKLLDGENVMMIWWRQSQNTDQWDVFVWSNKSSYIPTDDDYRNAKQAEIRPVQPRGKLALTWGTLRKP